jgi:glyoxylase-like metal-dependent hydrolase (beta-lactamase superfamily II)
VGVTEPREIADSLDEVVDGVWHWRIHNAGIGGAISSSHAVAVDGGCVLVDPVRLDDELLASLPAPTAIALDATTHQRSAWRYRAEFGIDVWLPEDARAGDEEPDRRYAEGDVLPGGLLAIRTPGPEWPHYSFLLERDPGVLICSDLISGDGDELHFVPPEYHDDAAETRRSVERLLDLPFAVLCLDHGIPITDDPKGALRRLLETTA